MITFERTTDYDTIRAVLTHKRVYPKISDDNSPAAEDYYPIEHESIWYVLARDYNYIDNDSDLLGVWLLVPQNSVCWEVHTALLPCAWGDIGLEAAKLLPGWIWQRTPCRRIITNVPANNRLALHFAWKAGMRVFGTNEKSWLKDGKLWDQIMLGISAPSEHVLVEEMPEKVAKEV